MLNDNSSLPHRRSVRLPDYDYGQAGAYFVTICTHKRRCMLGEVIGERAVLNDAGRTVEEEWLRTAQLRSNVALDQFVIMPNHVHGIIWIIGQKAGTARRAPTGERFGRPVTNSLATIVRMFKSSAARRINELRKTPGAPAWQRGYHEHVIRGEKDLNALREYVLNNPLQWALDSENPANIGEPGTARRAPTETIR